MRIVKIANDTDKNALLERIGVTKEGSAIMKKKMDLHLFYLSNLRTPAANILKQDALSIGAELAVERDTILCKEPYVDALLIANSKQVEILSKKELSQPFGLKKVAEVLGCFVKSQRYEPKIMGILNANADSFYAKSRFDAKEAQIRIEEMIEEGAEIIDIGAVSSRPGSHGVSEEEEFSRLRDIVDLIDCQKLYESARFSLDSYAPRVIAYALDRGFTLINDITGLRSDEVAKLCGRYSAGVVIMHMQGDPATMQNNPFYEDVMSEVRAFFKERIDKAHDFGIDEIILDVGIGFGKRLEDNLALLKHLEHFSCFGRELLVGASRKSMIDAILPTPLEERLPATLAIHLKAIENGASIVRVHDVKAHKQALSIYRALEETLL